MNDPLKICSMCAYHLCVCSDDSPQMICSLCYQEECSHYVSFSDLKYQERCCILQSSDEPTNSVQENVHYKDANAGVDVTYNPITDNTFYADYNVGSELGDFLSRPVLLGTQEWLDGGSFDTDFAVWHAYFNNSIIKNKLENFAFVSCNLHIKIMINASPFYYGLALASYRPLPSFNPGAIVDDGVYDKIPKSQRPHIWIYPQCNQGGDLVLPFVYYKNWLDVMTGADFTNMGTLNLESITTLLNANGIAGTGVDIKIYGWAEDVRVAGPTQEAALQSQDEYSTDGIISKPASAIAQAAGMLTKVPVIGPYMTATGIVASAIANVSAWFGFTNTPVIEDVKPFKNMPFHSLASAEIGQPVDKLTLDPKNELTIDPRVGGVDPRDELVLSDIAQRESYLTHFAWNIADTDIQNLFSAYVSPNLFGYDVANGRLYGTPMSHLADMFHYWRGDIIFRFRFIVSQYHRGRVRIIWDPVGDISGNSGTYTSNYNRIVDISAEPDIEVRIPYLQARAWLKLYNSGAGTYYSNRGTLGVDPAQTHENGVLNMRVFTQLTAPDATADAQVVVSVRAAENIQFAAPRELSNSFSPFAVQGLDEFGHDAVTEDMFPSKGDCGYENLVYMGEKVTSLRQLLRRSCLSRVHVMTADTTNRFYTAMSTQARVPLTYGFDLNGIDTATGLVSAVNEPFNYVSNNPYTHMQNCFVGRRGSMIWHFNTASAGALGQTSVTRSSMLSLSVAGYKASDTTTAALSQSAASRDVLFNQNEPGCAGISVLNQNTQTGLSVLAPMYSSYRFLNTDPAGTVLGKSIDDTDEDSITVRAAFQPTDGQDPSKAAIYEYFSIGTDFSFLFFLNVPTLYYYSQVPFAP